MIRHARRARYRAVGTDVPILAQANTQLFVWIFVKFELCQVDRARSFAESPLGARTRYRAISAEVIVSARTHGIYQEVLLRGRLPRGCRKVSERTRPKLPVAP